MQKKLVLLFAGIVLAFALLVGRITYINAFNGDKYSKIVLDQQQYQSRTIPFKRGDIVDRNGTKLATSQRVYNVILDAKVMNSDEKYVDPTIQVFGRISSGCDLSAVGGTPKSAATIGLSSTVSNWKKRYKDVRIIDSSASGLWEKRSCNLLDLL